jgi:SAM-dependent methyltransferase
MNSIPNEIILEEIQCPNNCSGESDLVLSGRDLLHSLPGEFNIYRCRKCGLERTTPRPSNESMGYYYPESYGPYSDNPFIPLTSNGLKGRIIDFLGLESRKLPSIAPSRMLELGCSSGGYMEYARSKGWDVQGIEFSPMAANLAIEKGFKVQIGSVENATYKPKEFNIIVAWMVMEHLHYPGVVLNKCLDWLNDDGYLVFLVPDRDSISRKLFGSLSFDTQLPTHLFHYNEKSLKILLNNFGWDIVKIKHQSNCNTFLKSLENWCSARKFIRIGNYVHFFNTSNTTRIIRLMLSVIFGLLKQSGRIEVWAKPIKKYV